MVAYPAEIPVDPFTKSAGNLAGITVGSVRESSKLGANSTVSLSISRTISLLTLERRASV